MSAKAHWTVDGATFIDCHKKNPKSHDEIDTCVILGACSSKSWWHDIVKLERADKMNVNDIAKFELAFDSRMKSRERELTKISPTHSYMQYDIFWMKLIQEDLGRFSQAYSWQAQKAT